MKAALLAAQFHPTEGTRIPKWHYDQHNMAVSNPKGIELGIVGMIAALEHYASEYRKETGVLVGEDGYTDTLFLDILNGIKGLLNCETGRLDCGKIDTYLTNLAGQNGITQKQLDCGIEK